MIIEFNKETWYSRLAAIILFVLFVPAWAFFLGIQYWRTIDLVNNYPQLVESNSEVPVVSAGIAGRYSSGDAVLTITRGSLGKYSIKGNAIWMGENAEFGQVNSGDIEGDIAVRGSNGRYEKDGCTVDIIFSEDTLEAKDNGRCGGLNVSFTGTYARENEGQN